MMRRFLMFCRELLLLVAIGYAIMSIVMFVMYLVRG